MKLEWMIENWKRWEKASSDPLTGYGWYAEAAGIANPDEFLAKYREAQDLQDAEEEERLGG